MTKGVAREAGSRVVLFNGHKITLIIKNIHIFREDGVDATFFTELVEGQRRQRPGRQLLNAGISFSAEPGAPRRWVPFRFSMQVGSVTVVGSVAKGRRRIERFRHSHGSLTRGRGDEHSGQSDCKWSSNSGNADRIRRPSVQHVRRHATRKPVRIQPLPAYCAWIFEPCAGISSGRKITSSDPQ